MPDNQDQTPSKMTATKVPEINSMTPLPPAPAAPFKADNSDIAAQWQEFQAQQGVTVNEQGNVVPVAPVAAPGQPAQPQAPQAQAPAVEATPPAPVTSGEPPAPGQAPEVPPKFQDANGGLDKEKLEKATLNAEEAIAKYRERERELTKAAQSFAQAKAQVNQPQQLQAQPLVQQAQQPQPSLTLEQVTPQMIQESIKQYGQEAVMMDLVQMAKREALAQATGQVSQTVESLQSQVEARQRADELKTIAQNDPWVFTEDGMKALTEIRTQNPWINQSPEPWKAALMYHKGSQALAGRSTPQVPTPNPTPQAGRVPPTPASGAAPIPKQALPVNLNNPQDLNRHLASLSKDKEAEFWNAQLKGLGDLPPPSM